VPYPPGFLSPLGFEPLDDTLPWMMFGGSATPAAVRWFGPTGDCACCDGPCGGCQPETITISITGATGACTGCDDIDGTYVLSGGSSCSWSSSFTLNFNCEFEDPYLYIGEFGAINCFGTGNHDGLAIQITASPGGGFDLRVLVTKIYADLEPPFTIPQQATQHTSIFEMHFDLCADIIGEVIPFLENDSINLPITNSLCDGFGTTPVGPGDYCNLDGATVTILSVT